MGATRPECHSCRHCRCMERTAKSQHARSPCMERTAEVAAHPSRRMERTAESQRALSPMRRLYCGGRTAPFPVHSVHCEVAAHPFRSAQPALRSSQRALPRTAPELRARSTLFPDRYEVAAPITPRLPRPCALGHHAARARGMAQRAYPSDGAPGASARRERRRLSLVGAPSGTVLDAVSRSRYVVAVSRQPWSRHRRALRVSARPRGLPTAPPPPRHPG